MARLYKIWIVICFAVFILMILLAADDNNATFIDKYYHVHHRMFFSGIYLPAFLIGIAPVTHDIGKTEVVIRCSNNRQRILLLEYQVLKYSTLFVGCSLMVNIILVIMTGGFVRNLKFYPYEVTVFSTCLELTGYMLIGNFYSVLRLAGLGSLISWFIVLVSQGLSALLFGSIDQTSEVNYIVSIYKSMFVIQADQYYNLFFRLLYLLFMNFAFVFMIIKIMSITDAYRSSLIIRFTRKMT